MTKDHVAVNKAHWDGMAEDWVALGEELWALDVPRWGIWRTPDHDAPLLPMDMAGMDAVELGCGTGYVSGWMRRRGARVTAIDVSPRQLKTAKRLSKEHDAAITFIEGNAENTGLPDASFDFAVSEYGAAIWCDPDVWIPEAFRIMRPGGSLVFLGNHPLVMVATPLDGSACDDGMHRRYRRMDRFDWSDAVVDPGGLEFNRAIGDWFALFQKTGFHVTDYRELYPRDDDNSDFGFISAEWARRFPSEHVWWLRKP